MAAPLPPTPGRTPDIFPIDQRSPSPSSDLPSESAVISELRTALERARAEFSLRHYDSVKSILDDLRNKLRHLDGSSPSNTKFASLICLLKASTWCLYGRLSYYLGALEGSKSAFNESVHLFESQDLALVRENSRICTDYAISLSRIGRMDDAFKLLKEICESGVAPHEAFGYLGWVYQAEEHWAEAEDAYRKGLQLAPGDPNILQYLAETLEAEKMAKEATEAYCDAALAAINLEDMQTAAEFANRALNLTPTDAEALNIAFKIAYKHQGIEASMAIVERVLQHDAKHSWALGLKATLLREIGRPEEAINILREIDVCAPELAWIFVERAKVLLQINPGNGEEALHLLDLAYSLNPLFEGISYLRAEILIDDLNRPEEAVELLRKAIENEPNNILFANELGRALYLCDNMEEALKVFDDTLTNNPKSVEALVGRAVTLNAQGNFDQALGTLRRAARLDPENDIVFRLMVDSLIENDRSEEALEEVDSKIHGNLQNSAYCYWKKGQILLKQSNYNNAAEALEQAALLAPNDADVQLDLAEAWCQLDKDDKAGEAYTSALKLAPDSINAIFNNAYYLSQIAAFRESFELINQAIEKFPNEAWFWGLRGWCLSHIGDRPSVEAAYESYKKACELSQERQGEMEGRFQKGLANTLFQLDRRDEAKKNFEEIIEQQKYKKGNEIEILQLLGWCHYRLARYDEAMRLLQQALSVDEEPITVRFDLALTMLAGSRDSLALTEYQGAIEMASKKHRLRQRGLYYIALFDLVDAAKDGIIGSDSREIFEQLRCLLAESGVDLSMLRWLGKDFPVCL
ncbi:tetratricopeptide repeat protein [Methylovulum miyakonense]|uniref:tetratricopeptide repeat protein n=1 Tax=Methylovulum miyakonense TaxID=645578 RepID=UPI0003A34BE7|nr:tetratricopeptide repeat protein [Methylovulum miyakonense]